MLEDGWTRPRALLTAATTAALLAGGLAPGASAAAPSCKGRNLLIPGGLIKVVDRGSGPRAHRYVACAKTDASIARRLRGTRRGARLEFLDNRGAMLAVRDPASRAVTVWNVAGKDRIRLRRGGRDPVGRVVVAQTGAAAAQFRRGSRIELVGFDYDGTAYRLDIGAIRSPRVGTTGTRIGWTKDGRTRTADLSQPAIPCGKLGGKTVHRSADANVVSFTYPVEFLDRELNGLATLTRGCARPDGRVRVLGEGVADPAGGVQGGSDYTVADAAGTYVLGVSRTEDSGGDSNPVAYATYELRTGKRVRLWGNADAGGPNQALGDAIGVAVVTATGQAASSFATDASGEQLVAFDAAGRPRVLDAAPTEDEIDESSLAVSGTVLSWLRNDERRTADLAGP